MAEVFLSSETTGQFSQDPRWDNALPQLGYALKALRLKQSITLRQLHYQTQIPLYHLEALEIGDARKLPPPVYIRGFVQRIGKVLGEEGKILLEHLPPIEQSIAVPTTNSTREKQSSPAKHRALQYFCAAFLAGAVGYIVWAIQQEQPVALSIPTSTPGPAIAAAQ